MRVCFSLLLIASVLPAHSQIAPSTEAHGSVAKAVLAQEAAIYEQISTTATYQTDGTGDFENATRVRLQSSAGVQQFGLLSFPYQKSFQEITIGYVRVRKPDGSVISTSLDDVQDIEAEVTREAPFYSDLREKHIAVKGLAVGDVLEWTSKTRIFKALAPNHFWLDYNFRKDVIVRDEQLRLEVPKDMYVKVKSREPQPQINSENGQKIYVWKHSQLERPPEDLKEKFARPSHHPQADIQVSTFKSWEDVGDWYNSLQQEKAAPGSEIRSKAIELTKSAKTEDEKLHALYDFVSTHFRYIGVSFGLGRYQPHSASDVLDNSYGDCKDKHTLLAALLQAVGIHASPALISTGFELDPDVPSPGQFDHLITAVHRGDSLLWLDTTAEVAPFGLLLQPIRGKQALVVEPDRRSKLATTPANPPFPSSYEVKVTGSLNEAGELKASFEECYRGDAEVILRSAFHRVPQPQWKDLVQQMSQNLGFAGKVSDVVSSSPENTSEPFHFSYNYDRTDYSDWVKNRRITPPTPPIGVFSLNDEYEKSGQPIELGAPTEIKYVAELQLPKGYTPQLPPNAVVKTDFAVYDSSYSLDKGTLHATRSMKTIATEVAAAEYAKYREFDRKVTEDASTWITFTGGTPGATESASVAAPANWPFGFPAPPDTEAGRGFRDGVAQLQAQRPTEALAKFEQAAKLDPKIPGLWVALGTVRLMLKDVDGGLEALRRQTQELPNDPLGWRALAFAFMGMQRYGEAIPALQKWNSIAPNDRDATANLGRALLSLKRYKEAISPLQKAVELNSDSELMEYSLGNAFFGAEQYDAAYEHYAKSISLANDRPAYENDAAYNLATKNVRLDEAETWAVDAVRDREKETLEVKSLDDLDIKHIRLMNLLAAYWDTLGYIYYRRGNYPEAEKYIRSSWDLNQDSVVAEHLGDVYDKMHEPSKALRFYSLAANSPKPSEEVQDKLFRLIKAGVHEPPKWQPREEFGHMRTVHLPPFGKQHASAEFMVMVTNKSEAAPPAQKLSESADGNRVTAKVVSTQQIGKPGNGRVEQVKFVSGSEGLRKMEEVLLGQNLPTEFPDDSPTNIFRRGILMCGGYVPGCEFTLLTADSVHSAN